jgi:hypothetical protein
MYLTRSTPQKNYDLAIDPHTPSDVLDQLARLADDGSWVSVVAGNPNTPPETLTYLSGSKRPCIREVVATNPHTPPDTLVTLAKDRNRYVRLAAICNRSMPQDDLSVLDICPATGDFTGWKKVECGVILELRIIGRRLGGRVGRKCRTDHARVVAAHSNLGCPEPFASYHNPNYTYTVGKDAISWLFDPDWRHECAPGIHFFMTRQEAEYYTY